MGLRVYILGPPSTFFLRESPYLCSRAQHDLLTCIPSACASYPRIDFVQDPPDGRRDLGAQINGHGEVDGETNQVLQAVQDEHVDGEPEDSGEGNSEENLPERRHRDS